MPQPNEKPEDRSPQSLESLPEVQLFRRQQLAAMQANLPLAERMRGAQIMARSYDIDNDGRLSASEAYRVASPGINLDVRLSFIEPLAIANIDHRNNAALSAGDVTALVDDHVLPRNYALEGLGHSFNLSAEQMQEVLGNAFPQGIDPLHVSDVCRNNPGSNCMALPTGKIAVFGSPGHVI